MKRDGTPRTARPVRPNVGVEQGYSAAIRALVDQMHSSIEWWVTATYRQYPPRVGVLVVTAEDATPSDHMRRTLRGLVGRWAGKFDEAAPGIAERHMRRAYQTSGNAFAKSLTDAGWAIRFTMSPAMTDAFNATLQENVSLIRSIPAQYLQQVEGAVMRSYTGGRDLLQMVTDLKQLYPKAAGRASIIARDQTNKANAAVNRIAQLELGITEADWVHSGGGKVPRPSHVAAGKPGAPNHRYNIAQGCYIDGEYIQPGELINCRCVNRPVLPF